jgi:WD40 repeat protein
MTEFLPIFVVVVLLLQGCQGPSLPESMIPITFEHLIQSEVTAEEQRDANSSDGTVVLKVEGPRFTGFIRLYETATNRPLGPEIALAEAGVSYRVTSLAVAPDNMTVAAAIGNFSNDWGEVSVWNATSGKMVAQYEGPPFLGEVFDLSFSADGKVVIITTSPSGGK